MTERPEVGGGGMTGATGDLTPEDTDEAFDPGERREVEDPAHAGGVTSAQIRRATGDRGLDPDDPAHQFERHPTPGESDAGEDPSATGRETRLGGDDRSEEADHF